MNGRTVSEAIEGQRRYDVVVRFDDASRGSLDALKNVTIDTPSDAQIPASAIATIEDIPGPNQVLRENTQHNEWGGADVPPFSERLPRETAS